MKSHVVSYARAFVLMPLLFLLSVTGKGQNQPVYNVPGPEIANLGLYGQVPVSYYTGVPDISVPLHEIKVGKFSMPITASYHVRSVKPNQTPGPLGLGWNLIAGGYITRNVRGYCDEYLDKEGTPIGFFSYTSKLNETSTNYSKFDGFTEDFFTWNKKTYELCADEFSFDFCGYQGNFYLNKDGGWSVVSDYDIKVEFDSINGFASLNDLKTRFMGWSHWSKNGASRRYFCKFTLITPDGCRYEFGGINAIEFSIDYYDRNNSNLYATSWRLTKIITPDKRIINIDYLGYQTCELQYIPRFSQRGEYPMNNGSSWDSFWLGDDQGGVYDAHPYKTGRLGYTGNLIFPVRITKITTPNEIIEFLYTRDIGFGQMFAWDALYWDTTGWKMNDIFKCQTDDPANQFLALTSVAKLDSENETRNAIAAWLEYYYLTNITIQPKNRNSLPIDYTFTYKKNKRRKLTGIVKQDFATNNDAGTKSGIYTTGTQEYHFGYNTTQALPEKFIVGKTDSWGYYHGDNNVLSQPFNESDLQLVQPVTSATKAEVLTEIQYPTGGRSLLEYEQNTYSYIVDSAHTVVHKSGYAGGLRISKITNLDRDNHISGTKRFYYSQTKTSTSSGILRAIPIMSIRYTARIRYNSSSGDVFYCCEQKSYSGYYPPVTNMNSPDVGYSWVIEESLDPDNNPLGYVRYHFSNYDTDINGHQHLDSPAIYSHGVAVNSSLASFTSNSLERGKLLSKEYYDSNGNMMRKEKTNYLRTQHAPLLTAYQNTIMFNVNVYANLGWLTYTHTASYLPVSVTETIRSTNGQTVEYRTKTFEYNTHKMLSRETCSMSDGTEEVTTYKYPFDYIKYRWMTNANITSPVIEKKVTAGGLTHTETDEYASNSSGVPYIQKRTVGTGGSGRTEFEVSRVDSYGNPVEMTVNGVSNVLCWGYEGQRLLARVENATFTKLKYLLNMNPNATTMDYSALVNGRSLLPSALFHLYQYDANLRLQSETTPNGITTFYKYDNFGRLCEIYYIDGVTGNKKLLESYGYHYYNQQQ